MPTLLALFLAPLLAQLQPLPPQLVPLDSPAGEQLLFESSARAAYFPLTSSFVTQQSTAFCGVASAVMVLNALPIAAPVAKEWAPFRAFTQENVFAPQSPITAALVSSGGLTMEQLGALLRANGADADVLNANDSALERFRADASAALAKSAHHVLVDFSRPELGQDLGAHWSPLAAYNAKEDRFLVLDVARFRYPPYWARTADLFAAMNTRDLDSGKQRGYILVTPHTGAAGRIEIPSLRHRMKLYALLASSILLCIGATVGAFVGRSLLRRKLAKQFPRAA